jgi:predicted ABC-type ATPase
MKNPTPIDKLPSYLERVKAAREHGYIQWLPYVIVGSLVIAALYIAHRLHQSSALVSNQVSTDEND